jgi:hypothetical protein
MKSDNSFQEAVMGSKRIEKCIKVEEDIPQQ